MSIWPIINQVLTCANNMLHQSIRTLLSLLRVWDEVRPLKFFLRLFQVFFRLSHLLPSVFGTASLNFGIHLPKTDLSRLSSGLNSRASFQIRTFGSRVLLVSQPAQSQRADFGANRTARESPLQKQENISSGYLVILYINIQFSSITISFKYFH